MLDVRPGFPAKTVKELIDYAKANPDKVTFASQGNGSTSHLTAILFQKLTGTKMVHVPYRGTTPALQDIMGNTVDLFFDNLGSSLEPASSAASCASSASAGPERAPSLPDVPTVRESGVPDFTSVTWFALMAPKGTPDAIIAKLNATVGGHPSRRADVKAQFEKLGVQVDVMDVNGDGEIHRGGTRPMGRNHQVGERHGRLSGAAKLIDATHHRRWFDGGDDLLDRYSAQKMDVGKPTVSLPLLRKAQLLWQTH